MNRSIYSAVLLVALAALGSGAAAFAIETTGSGTSASPSSVPLAGVAVLHLSSHYRFSAFVKAENRLWVTGTVAAPSASDNNSATCVIAPVRLHPLALGAPRVNGCNDPRFSGRAVAPVTTYSKSSQIDVAIDRVDPSTGAVSTGPVIMTCAYSSDTRPVFVYGGGQLWLYDVATLKGPQAIEVSATTGTIEETVAMPQLYRPIIAADSDGLWIANSNQGTSLPDVLYHVAPKSNRVVGLLTSSDAPHTLTYAAWLVAGGHVLWAGLDQVSTPNDFRQSVLGLDGPGARVSFTRSGAASAPTYDLFGTVIGDSATGLWAAGPASEINGHFRATNAGLDTATEDLVHINPSDGAEQVVGTLGRFPLLNAEEGLAAGQMAIVGQSLFVLEPPFDAYGYLGYEKLAYIERPAAGF